MALADPEHIQELFSAFGRVSVRRMFGGAGVFADGLMFGLIADDELFLKADEETIPAFRAEGMKPFSYGTKKSRRVVMSYWHLPNRLLDDPDELAEWARAALTVARRKTAKPKQSNKLKRSKRPAARKRKAHRR